VKVGRAFVRQDFNAVINSFGLERIASGSTPSMGGARVSSKSFKPANWSRSSAETIGAWFAGKVGS
jgi:hypothetical protein